MQDKLAMRDMEHVQTIAWTVEIATLVVTLVIAWVVWKVTRTAVREKQSKAAKNEEP